MGHVANDDSTPLGSEQLAAILLCGSARLLDYSMDLLGTPTATLATVLRRYAHPPPVPEKVTIIVDYPKRRVAVRCDGWLEIAPIGSMDSGNQASVSVSPEPVADANGEPAPPLEEYADYNGPDAKRSRWLARVQSCGTTTLALVRWGEEFGDDLPGREELLRQHRNKFGRIRGINLLTMRAVRRDLIDASAEGSTLRRSVRGGTPQHRKWT